MARFQTTSTLQQATVSWRVVAYTLMIIFTVLTVYPLFWLFYSSFKTHSDIVRFPLAFPRTFLVDNYVRAWTMANLGVSLTNSFVYTISATLITLFLALAAAFGITKFGFKKSSAFFTAVFALGLMIAVHAIIIPLFIVERTLGLLNRRIGIIIPYVAFDLPMSIMIAISYVRGIPDAIIESAEIDGAKYRYVFWKMIVPLSTPVIATMVILSFLRHWNEFLFVFIFTTRTALRSLPVAIRQFAGRENIEYGLQYASLVIGILPMIIFYICFHAQLIKGFGEGSLKE